MNKYIESVVEQRLEDLLKKHNVPILEHISLYQIVEEMQNALADISDDAYGIDCTMSYVKALAELVINEGY